jgi:probable rRNA maturation factor
VIVNVFDQQSALKISVDQVQQLVQTVVGQEGHSCDQVDIYFVDVPTISQLHEQFFDDPSPTDCISFPMDEKEAIDSPYRVLGEVFICPAAAIEYAAEHEGDAYMETTLYLVHGLLHLMGYRDLEERDILLMRGAEARHMRNLESKNIKLSHPST